MTHERYEHGPLVEAWLKEPTFVPAADLNRVSESIAQIPQRSERTFRLPDLRFQHMLNATKITAAVAILGVSGALLTTKLTAPGPSSEQAPAVAETSIEPTASVDVPAPTEPVETAQDVQTEATGPGIRLPDDPAAVADSGTLGTPAGPARWVRLDPDEVEVPLPGKVLTWADGIAVWRDVSREDFGSEPTTIRPATLYATSDGVAWREVPLPTEVAERRTFINETGMGLDHIGGRTVLYSLQDDGMWTFADGDWQPVDTSALTEARPKGWGTDEMWDSGFRMVAGRPVIGVQQRYNLPRAKLGIPRKGGTNLLVPLGDMRYAICSKGTCNEREAERILRFRETEDGLVVRSDRTGERIALLKKARADELYQGSHGTFRNDFALEGDRLVELEPERPRGFRNEPRKGLPTPLPEGADAWHSGSANIVGAPRGEPEQMGRPRGELPAQAHDVWLHLGGDWIDLARLDFPWLKPYMTGTYADAADNATLIWFTGDLGLGSDDDFALWVVEHPTGP